MTQLNRGIEIGFNYSVDRPDIIAIKMQLREIIREEEKLLRRMARKAEEHNCSKALVDAIWDEIRHMDPMNPEYILDPFQVWQFAFHYPERRRHEKRREMFDEC